MDAPQAFLQAAPLPAFAAWLATTEPLPDPDLEWLRAQCAAVPPDAWARLATWPQDRLWAQSVPPEVTTSTEPFGGLLHHLWQGWLHLHRWLPDLRRRWQDGQGHAWQALPAAHLRGCTWTLGPLLAHLTPTGALDAVLVPALLAWLTAHPHVVPEHLAVLGDVRTRLALVLPPPPAAPPPPPAAELECDWAPDFVPPAGSRRVAVRLPQPPPSPVRLAEWRHQQQRRARAAQTPLALRFLGAPRRCTRVAFTPYTEEPWPAWEFAEWLHDGLGRADTERVAWEEADLQVWLVDTPRRLEAALSAARPRGSWVVCLGVFGVRADAGVPVTCVPGRPLAGETTEAFNQRRRHAAFAALPDVWPTDL